MPRQGAGGKGGQRGKEEASAEQRVGGGVGKIIASKVWGPSPNFWTKPATGSSKKITGAPTFYSSLLTPDFNWIWSRRPGLRPRRILMTMTCTYTYLRIYINAYIYIFMIVPSRESIQQIFRRHLAADGTDPRASSRQMATRRGLRLVFSQFLCRKTVGIWHLLASCSLKQVLLLQTRLKNLALQRFFRLSSSSCMLCSLRDEWHACLRLHAR